jgi:general secretion pathway protein E
MEGPYLEIQTHQGAQHVALDDGPVTIGRHSDNNLVLADPKASRFHCVIEKAGAGYRVRDLKSANGTLVDGQRVTTAALQSGSEIQIGSMVIRLIMPGVAARRTARTARVAPLPDENDPATLLDNLSDEDIDELGDEDIVGPLDGGAAEPQLDDLISMVGDGEATGEHERVLRNLADALPDRSFAESDIALVNARGGIMHQAGQEVSRTGTKREAVDALRQVLLVCFRSRASDIHLEPKQDGYQLRVRVDGTMVDVVKFTNDMGVKLTALVKILSDIDVTKKDIIQEGHFGVRLPDRSVDYRVSYAPTVFGQKLVVRVLDTASTPTLAKDLELPPSMMKEIHAAIEQAAGMVLVCGPTGSGKTTSLYALIRSINVNERNVVTIEDPVEIQLEGVTQIPVNDAAGRSFSALLRSVLRQDPDVILVGEIRDSETARIAMQASMTGHLVFSTIHTKDTVGTIFRLLDLGVEPYLVAQGLHLVLAQRLVRRLCPYCKKPSRPTPEQLAKMGPAGEGVKVIYSPAGCPRCLGTGYSGRRAFFELLTASDMLKDLILRQPTLNQILEALGTEFKRLAQTGYLLVAEGVVAMEEIERAVGR